LASPTSRHGASNGSSPISPSWTDGDIVQSADIGPVIREIVGRFGWQSCNDLVLILDGSNPLGRRFISSFDRNPDQAPRLRIVEGDAPVPTPAPTPPGPTPTPAPIPTPDTRPGAPAVSLVYSPTDAGTTRVGVMVTPSELALGTVFVEVQLPDGSEARCSVSVSGSCLSEGSTLQLGGFTGDPVGWFTEFELGSFTVATRDLARAVSTEVVGYTDTVGIQPGHPDGNPFTRRARLRLNALLLQGQPDFPDNFPSALPEPSVPLVRAGSSFTWLWPQPHPQADGYLVDAWDLTAFDQPGCNGDPAILCALKLRNHSFDNGAILPVLNGLSHDVIDTTLDERARWNCIQITTWQRYFPVENLAIGASPEVQRCVAIAGSGDVDADCISNTGDSDLQDAFLVVKIWLLSLFGLELPNCLSERQGDVNGDGSTDLVDAMLLAQCAIGWKNVACPEPITEPTGEAPAAAFTISVNAGPCNSARADITITNTGGNTETLSVRAYKSSEGGYGVGTEISLQPSEQGIAVISALPLNEQVLIQVRRVVGTAHTQVEPPTSVFNARCAAVTFSTAACDADWMRATISNPNGQAVDVGFRLERTGIVIDAPLQPVPSLGVTSRILSGFTNSSWQIFAVQDGLDVASATRTFADCPAPPAANSCSATPETAVCQTRSNLGGLTLSPANASWLLSHTSNNDEPIVAIGGDQPIDIGGLASLATRFVTERATPYGVSLVAAAAVTEADMVDLVAQETAAHTAFLNHRAGLDIDESALPLGLSLGQSGDHVTISNEFNMVIAAWPFHHAAESIELSELTREFRLDRPLTMGAQYQEWLDSLYVTNAMAAFVLYRTGNLDLATEVSELPLGCTDFPDATSPCEETVSPWNRVHLWLDIAGFIPVIGEVFDLVNAAIYVAEGSYFDAGLSSLAIIPVAGSAFTGSRAVARHADEAVETFVDARGQIFHRSVQSATYYLEASGGGLVRGVSDLARTSAGRNQVTQALQATITGCCPAISDDAVRLAAGTLSKMTPGQQNIVIAAIADAVDGPAAERIARAIGVDSALSRLVIQAEIDGATGVVAKVFDSNYFASQIVDGASQTATDTANTVLRNYLDDLTSAFEKGWSNNLNGDELEALHRTILRSNGADAPFGETYERLISIGYRFDPATSAWSKPGDQLFPQLQSLATSVRDNLNALVTPLPNTRTLPPLPAGRKLSHWVGQQGEQLTSGLLVNPVGQSSPRIFAEVFDEAAQVWRPIEVRPDFVTSTTDGAVTVLRAVESKATQGTDIPRLSVNQILFYEAIADGGSRLRNVTAMPGSALAVALEDSTFTGVAIYHWFF